MKKMMSAQPFTRSGANVMLELPDASQVDFGTCSTQGRGSELAGYVSPCEQELPDYYDCVLARIFPSHPADCSRMHVAEHNLGTI